ncbi:hypothetical protein Tco_0874365 [Tanacetum coccineum]|uniref:Reverse transcriptase domain-containing protein n=1 Tax=Tanacetum coccineum TaxID=301880 RepID=A0ABQ5BQL0_9ASTR
MDDNSTCSNATSSIEGYEDAIVVPPITANNFELKQTLINLVQGNQFTGRQDPHNHLRFFNKKDTAQDHLREKKNTFLMESKPKAKKTVNIEIQDLNSPRPNSYQSKLPYPERMKVRENDKPSAQHSRFLKMFKQLRLEIGLKDALVEMPKFNKWLSSLLRNKEKLEEIAITTVNAECSAIIMNKVPEKLEDPVKFLIPCALQELDRTSALADSELA